MEMPLVFSKLGIALGLGLLVGLQRERVQSQLAGIRTFALITVFGTVSALVGQALGGWVVALGGVAVAALLVVGNLAQQQAKESDPGLTTEVAALLMYAVGAYLVVGHTAVGIALGGGVALLLHLKAPMHAFVARIGEADIKAIMQFVLLALVIWPVLPDQDYGPYGALNPHDIWLMVVLIVGISLGGYVAAKLFGPGSGALVGGVLGGMISSTATTVSYARHTRQSADSIPVAATAIVIASTVVFVRVLAEVAVVAPGAFCQLAPPLGLMLAWMALISAGLYFFGRPKDAEPPPQANPAELKAALLFGGLYALALVGVAAARDYLGATGLYGVAAASGLYDLDAITLSTARLVNQGQLDAGTGWRLILTAALANLGAKAGIAAALGHRRLFRGVLVPFAVAIAGGIVLLLAWPGAAGHAPR
jgi:uncharacterized membrane protein (DUF4010 family)